MLVANNLRLPVATFGPELRAKLHEISLVSSAIPPQPQTFHPSLFPLPLPDTCHAPFIQLAG